MPTKFKKDEIIVKRTPDGKQSKTKKRHYIHTIKQEELIETGLEKKNIIIYMVIFMIV